MILIAFLAALKRRVLLARRRFRKPAAAKSLAAPAVAIASMAGTRTRVHHESNHLAWLELSLALQQQRMERRA